MDKLTFEARENGDGITSLISELSTLITTLESKKESAEELHGTNSTEAKEIRDVLATYHLTREGLKDAAQGGVKNKQELINRCMKSIKDMRPRFEAIINNEVH